MNTATELPVKGNRLYWLDNLRTVTIFLVVLYHVGGVYESAGLWGSFWIVDDPATITWVGIVGIIFDVMVMSSMFFISGYLIPASMRNKSGWRFIKGKLKRLMLPWLVAVFTLIPIYKIIYLYSRNLPQEHWSTYFHITNPNSQNWLWFLPVLFAFDILYLLFVKVKIKIPNISIKVAVFGSMVIGFAYSFVIGGFVGFRSWTLTPVLDFENERLLLYFVAFLLGVFFHQRNVLSKLSESKKLYNIVNATSWIPITVHISARVYPFLYPEGFSITPMYRLIWWSSFYLSLLCLLYLMIETFRRYFDRTGKIWDELNRNSYGVYIIHVILIGVFGTLLLNLNVPALVKYPSLIVMTYLGSNVIVSSYRTLGQKIKS
jgi:fucose 4-O-acetylase-like acetyltransferase